MQHSNCGYEPTWEARATLTNHARWRGAQRAITPETVAVIREFGERSHDGRGGVLCMMTRRAVQRLVRAVGHSQRVDAIAGTYAVFSADGEDRVITVGHAHARRPVDRHGPAA